MDLNLDAKTLEMCLKSINNFGSTTLVNICTGQTNIIPWGGIDWLVLIGLSAIVLIFIFIMLKMFFDL